MTLSLTALIIEPSPSKRDYLFQAMLAHPDFSKVRGSINLDEAAGHLATEGVHYDAILTSASFSQESNGVFISKAKELPGGKEAAFITVVNTGDQTKDKIAADIVAGTDGFLFMPFSVQALQEVAGIAARVKSEHEQKRRRMALELLISEICDALKNLVIAKHCQEEELEYRKAMVKCSTLLKRVVPVDKEFYFRELTERLEKAEPMAAGMYTGASKRLRNAARRKLRAQN